jgi:hypothetical protein
MFKDGRTNVHDEEQSSRPSLVSDLVQSVNQSICERWRFTISEFSCEFPETSRTVYSLRDYLCLARLSQVLLKMGSENAQRSSVGGGYVEK